MQKQLDSGDFNLELTSDWHGRYTRAANADLLRVSNEGIIDDHIMLGDALADRYSNGLYSEYRLNNVLMVVGNHDMLNTASGYDWTSQPSRADAYKRFMLPRIEPTGIVCPDNRLWWYKLYDRKRVLLIGLDCMNIDNALMTEQSQFLTASLKKARELNYTVIIATHWPFNSTPTFKTTIVDCVMTQNHISYEANYGVNHGELKDQLLAYEESLVGLVNDHIKQGGAFACWLTGHWHNDLVQVYEKDGMKQICFTMNCTTNGFNDDVIRIDNTVSEVIADTLSLKPNGNLVLQRYGAQTLHPAGLRLRAEFTPQGAVVSQQVV